MRLVIPASRKVPIGTIGGISAIVAFVLCAAASILAYPGSFSPFEMWLGDYGFPGRNPDGAAYYNTGSMVGGLLLTVFFAGLYLWKTESGYRLWARGAGQVIGVVAGVALFIAGYVTPLRMPESLIASSTFFICIMTAILLLHLAYRTTTYYGEATTGMGMASVALSLLLIVAAVIGIEPVVAEWCAIFAIIAWVGLMSRDLYNMSKGISSEI